MDVLIRRAGREDVPAIVRLLSDDPLGSQREQYGADIPHSYYEAFERIEEDPSQMLMVAELDGQVIGTFQMTILRFMTYQGLPRAQVEAVRVDKDCRNRGIGRQMMEWAIAKARAESCLMVQLTTHKSRVDAHRFYRRLGFIDSHEGMKLYLDPHLP